MSWKQGRLGRSRRSYGNKTYVSRKYNAFFIAGNSQETTQHRSRSELLPPSSYSLCETIYKQVNTERAWVINFETFCLRVVHSKPALTFQQFITWTLPYTTPLVTPGDTWRLWETQQYCVSWLLPFVEEDCLSEIRAERPASHTPCSSWPAR